MPSILNSANAETWAKDIRLPLLKTYEDRSTVEWGPRRMGILFLSSYTVPQLTVEMKNLRSAIDGLATEVAVGSEEGGSTASIVTRCSGRCQRLHTHGQPTGTVPFGDLKGRTFCVWDVVNTEGIEARSCVHDSLPGAVAAFLDRHAVAGQDGVYTHMSRG